MTVFESVKSAVTPRMAAERYGVQVNRSDMTRCPFHSDRTPSMKLNEDYFYCFGCTSRGDVIDLTAKLFHLIDAAFDAEGGRIGISMEAVQTNA